MFLISLFRYMMRDIDKDHQRFKRVVVITMNLFLALIMFAAMNISSYFGKFMVQHNIAVMLIVLAVVSIFQIALNIGSTLHRVPNPNPNPHKNNNNNNTMVILYILLLSSVISSIEVRLVSNTAAAIINFILCHITLTRFVTFNKQEIPRLIWALIVSAWFVFLQLTITFLTFLSLDQGMKTFSWLV
ncbi:hypothetical protein MtrunA17_Chr7g0217001 [Medicago truncatula]|uniref:Transmembrane protein n=1 Tax=Medicago truncatula TaxID=3880 RepID=A0A396GSS8_MEDTR|nr:hypothetical protein MtrunA17_Chr7g0217001 [Medicago truncatula]